MKPEIIRKKLLLVGFEAPIDFSSDFAQTLDNLRTNLKRNILRISDAKTPLRMVGYWQPDSLYFAGVEVLNIDTAPNGLIVKDLPESLFASFKEHQRGTVGGPDGLAYNEWLPSSGYKLNENLPGDFEVFAGMDQFGFDDECDILIPIRPK